MIATKLPSWMVKTESDFDKYINEQLEKLQTDYIDYYLLHGLNRPLWQKMKDMNALSFLDRLKKDGKIRRAGFSFHDDINIFKEIVDGYTTGTCARFSITILTKIIRPAGRAWNMRLPKAWGVVVMEPLRGGKLTEKIPEEIQAMWDTASTRRPRQRNGLALRWVWNHAGVQPY